MDSSVRATMRAALAGMLLLAALPPAAAAQQFNVPSACRDSVTGADEDLPPVVLVSDGKRGVEIFGLFRDKGGNWWVEINAKAYTTYLLLATYTPFLQSYRAFVSVATGIRTLPVPAPGVYSNKQYHLYNYVDITVYTTATSNTPMPGAFVEMAPDFDGSSPYALQADQNGVVHIGCFTAYPTGNPATVYYPNHTYAYDVNYDITPNRVNAATGVARPRALVPAVRDTGSIFRLP